MISYLYVNVNSKCYNSVTAIFVFLLNGSVSICYTYASKIVQAEERITKYTCTNFNHPGTDKLQFFHSKRLWLALLLCFSLLLGFASAENHTDPQLTKDLVILFTSDMHCGIDENWGMAGLYEIRQYYEKNNHVLLVDDGDAVQGEPIGKLTNGQAIIDLMNQLKYDVAVPHGDGSAGPIFSKS